MEYDAVLWGIGSLFMLSLGLIMGSFCNAFAWRLVRQQSILQGRSRCAALWACAIDQRADSGG